jgi:NADH-quinone oxidoreductase subunit C
VTPEEIIQAVGAGLPAVADPAVPDPAAAGPARAVCEVSQGTVTVLVPPAGWLTALVFARDNLGCDFFDWLSAVDELDAGLAVLAHVYSLAGRHHLLIRTIVAAASCALPTASGIYRGAAWHERETHEMFGVDFTGHPGLTPLLLPDGFEGHPLRKDFVLAARVAKEWPGAKDPGEGADGARGRRRLPPGVPERGRPG